MKQLFVWVLAGLVISTSLGLNGMSSAAEGEWTRKANMPTARGGLSTSMVNGKIYAIGGKTGAAVFPTVEEYDPATDTWTMMKASAITQRAHMTANTVDGSIYVFGGRTWGTTFIPTVEAYDTGFVPIQDPQEPQVLEEPEEPKSVTPKGKFITLWGTVKHSH